ncbi:MAG: hypothetical protein PHT38_01070 [Halothiobacillus sp.]|jgi:hypothetical protein|nr:hypothetical protein [Halothiobacillus sp.]
MKVDQGIAHDEIEDSGMWLLNNEEMISLENANHLTGSLAMIAYPLIRQSVMYEEESEDEEGLLDPLTETLQFILDNVETTRSVSLTDLGMTVANLVQEGLLNIESSGEVGQYLMIRFPMSDIGKIEPGALH